MALGLKFWHLKYKKVKGDRLVFHYDSYYSKITTKTTELVR